MNTEHWDWRTGGMQCRQYLQVNADMEATCSLHILSLRAGYDCVVQVLSSIAPLHLKVDSFLLDLPIVFNAGHGHAANAIKGHLHHTQHM